MFGYNKDLWRDATIFEHEFMIHPNWLNGYAIGVTNFMIILAMVIARAFDYFIDDVVIMQPFSFKANLQNESYSSLQFHQPLYHLEFLLLN